MNNITIYYIDTSVLLENIPLVKFIKNYLRDPSGLFSIISHVSLSMTYFWQFPSIILSMSFCLYNKKNITRRLEDMNFIFSRQKQYFTYSLAALVRKILFCHSKIKFISWRHRVISSMYRIRPSWFMKNYVDLKGCYRGNLCRHTQPT